MQEANGSGEGSYKLAQDTRAAAMRGLLHDFSNIMVGLSAISESAIQDFPDDEPLKSDLRIVRDSAVKAQEILRWLSSLNSRFPPILEQVDLEYWLPGETALLKALLPKGSEILIEADGERLGIKVVEEELRDALLIATRDSAMRQKGRLRLHLGVKRTGETVELEIRDEPFSTPSTIGPLRDETASTTEERMVFFKSFAGRYQAQLASEDNADGRRLCFYFPCASN